MHDLISGLSRSLLSRLLLLALISAALPGCANRERVASENFNTRVSLVVIHHTTENFADSLQTLTRRSAYPVSSHYLIPEPDDPTYDKGELRIYELVPEAYRAWHAGDSYWGGRTSLNDQSIGIELVNRTHCHRGTVDTGNGIVEGAGIPRPGTIDESTAIPDMAPASICFYPDFAESQIELLVDLLDDILRRHPSIKPTQIVGHSDIAPDRKIDPGPRFPWQRLHRSGFGAWYDDDTVIRYWERFRLQPLPLRNIQRALRVYGYGIEVSGEFDVQTRNVLRAFQMHFRPSQTYGSITTETVATLFALIEKYYPDQLDELLRVDVDVEEPSGPPSGGSSE
jgi:N-acetyl-anhydromuramyl-L-alanine amidase AmpD